MAVLGKRTRSSQVSPPSDSPSATPRSTRSLRRAGATKDFVIASDDVEDPFVTPRITRKRVLEEQDNDIDELSPEYENSPAKKRQNITTSPSKHGAAETRIAIDSPIPQTPRHRDRNIAKIAVTPRHRVGLLSKVLTPTSGRTPTTPRSFLPSLYDDARGLFKASVKSGKVIGREKERTELNSFITTRLEGKTSGCIYISGPPGTGKSALATEICHEIVEESGVAFSYLNCMAAKNAAGLFSKLLDDFGLEDVMEGTETTHLKKLFQSRSEPYLVILDEIDHLLDVDIELLYQLFEWSLQKKSSLVLVGIANALDFTDRFLPRLKSKGLKPQLLPFMPYSIAEVASVVTSKLKSLMPVDTETPDFIPFIHPTAIQFLSKKVAAQTGDLRKAFAICIRALELIEAETRTAISQGQQEPTPSASPSPSKTPLMENVNLSSPGRTRTPRKSMPNPLGHLNPGTAPRATIAHIARVTAAVFSTGATQRLTALNLQQKAALCALSALEALNASRAELLASESTSTSKAPSTPSKNQTAAPTIRSLHDVYSRLCKNGNTLQPLSLGEFRDVVVSLEGLSLVAWVDGRKGSLASAAVGTPSRRGRKKAGFGEGSVEEQKVVSCVGEKELRAGIVGMGEGALRGIVDGVGI